MDAAPPVDHTPSSSYSLSKRQLYKKTYISKSKLNTKFSCSYKIVHTRRPPVIRPCHRSNWSTSCWHCNDRTSISNTTGPLYTDRWEMAANTSYSSNRNTSWSRSPPGTPYCSSSCASRPIISSTSMFSFASLQWSRQSSPYLSLVTQS